MRFARQTTTAENGRFTRVHLMSESSQKKANRKNIIAFIHLNDCPFCSRRLQVNLRLCMYVYTMPDRSPHSCLYLRAHMNITHQHFYLYIYAHTCLLPSESERANSKTHRANNIFVYTYTYCDIALQVDFKFVLSVCSV